MVDITTIPTEELETDLKDSKDDIVACQAALLLGITEYSGGSVLARINANKHFVKVITAELERRQAVGTGAK